jgi:Fic family protein
MGDLEKFLHNTTIHVPNLIRIGIAHYQFETIHPFLDGNGRIGRLLITLYFIQEKMLAEPLLYISTFFERDKTLYYDNLTFVRTRGDLLGWLKYFLVGVEDTARRASDTLRAVLQLKTDLEKEISNDLGKRASSGLKLMTELFRDPVIRRREVEKALGLSRRSAAELVNLFERRGYLREITGRQRDQNFIFEPYVRLFE